MEIEEFFVQSNGVTKRFFFFPFFRELWFRLFRNELSKAFSFSRPLKECQDHILFIAIICVSLFKTNLLLLAFRKAWKKKRHMIKNRGTTRFRGKKWELANNFEEVKCGEIINVPIVSVLTR